MDASNKKIDEQLPERLSKAKYNTFHKECARDKPADRTTTCSQSKVPKLERWYTDSLFMDNNKGAVSMGKVASQATTYLMEQTILQV